MFCFYGTDAIVERFSSELIPNDGCFSLIGDASISSGSISEPLRLSRVLLTRSKTEWSSSIADPIPPSPAVFAQLFIIHRTRRSTWFFKKIKWIPQMASAVLHPVDGKWWVHPSAGLRKPAQIKQLNFEMFTSFLGSFIYQKMAAACFQFHVFHPFWILQNDSSKKEFRVWLNWKTERAILS